MNLVNKILKETIDVGEVLFGEDNKIAKYLKKPIELNTSTEDKIYSQIIKHIEGKNNNIASYYDELLKLKNKFPEILKPNAQFVYRGFNLKLSKAKPSIKKEGVKLFNDSYYILKNEINYISHPKISSWTTSQKIADEFANTSTKYYNDPKIQIIAKTEVDESFLFNPNFLNILAKKAGLSHEYEIITNKPNILCKIYLNKKQYDNYYG